MFATGLLSIPQWRLSAWLALKTCAPSALFLLFDARLIAINLQTLRLCKMNEQQYKVWW
jgi:hypothetical protein